MDAKEYLAKGGLTELNDVALDFVSVSRGIEKAFLDFVADTLAQGKCDPRWAAIAKTHFEEGGMAIRKAIAMAQVNQAEG